MNLLFYIIEYVSLYHPKINYLKKKPMRNNDIKHLGRWDIVYDSKIINKKIDLSNNDHCGSCGISSDFQRYLEMEKNIKIGK
jgi:hypothetical protein